MAHGGLVYVKRDVSSEEAPRTFDKERSNPLTPWIDFAIQAIESGEVDPTQAPAAPPAVDHRRMSSARNAILEAVQGSENFDVAFWADFIRCVRPALGSPWMGIDGSSYAEDKKSWLLSGKILGSAGWNAWAIAALDSLRDSPSDAAIVLPSRTVVEAWDGPSRGQWCYDLLEEWERASRIQAGTVIVTPVSKKRSPALPKAYKRNVAPFDQVSRIVEAIDRAVSSLDLPMGLPSHWRVAARQARACLHRPGGLDLDPVEMVPIHREVELAPPRSTTVWVGISEWLMYRYAKQMGTKKLDLDRWYAVCRLVKEDMETRDAQGRRLLAPFVDFVDRKIQKIDDAAIAPFRARLVGLALNEGTAKVSGDAPRRTRRL